MRITVESAPGYETDNSQVINAIRWLLARPIGDIATEQDNAHPWNDHYEKGQDESSDPMPNKGLSEVAGRGNPVEGKNRGASTCQTR